MRNKYVPEGKEGKGGRNKTDEFHKRRTYADVHEV